jgi:hypothetical protein
MSPELKYIRQVGLDLLNAEYGTREEANEAIRTGLREYYQENYPDIANNNGTEIERATAVLLKVYNENFFPEMKTDYRVRENNLSHFVNDGCFRCHDGVMENESGQTLSSDCSTCHLIVLQGPSEDISQLESNLSGMDFKHPEDIDEVWREFKCTECHTPESGY